MRVPLDFDWPLGERWKGYVNPHYHNCPECDGRGETASAQILDRWIRVLLLCAEESQFDDEAIAAMRGRGRIYPHPYLQNDPMWIRKRGDLGDDLLPLVEGIVEVDQGPLGFGSTAAWKFRDKFLEFAGADPETWGRCQLCSGEGIDPEYKEAAEAWTEYPPPEGNGFQLWETTSEGSPVSPVFGTLEELCEWAAENATTFADFKASKEEWMKMLDEDFVHHAEGSAIFF